MRHKRLFLSLYYANVKRLLSSNWGSLDIVQFILENIFVWKLIARNFISKEGFNKRVIITQQNCYTSIGLPHILHLRLYGALINAHKLLFDAEPQAHSATYTPVNSVTRAVGYENQLNCLSTCGDKRAISFFDVFSAPRPHTSNIII
jgi:hypothetical protein